VHRVDDALHGGPDALGGGSAAARWAGAAGGADQVVQVRALGVVELQGACDAVDDALGDAGGAAAFEPGVVVSGDAGQEGDLLAAQARDPPTVPAVGGEPRLLRADPVPAGGQELAYLAAHVPADVRFVTGGGHGVHPMRACAGLGVPVSPPFAGPSRVPRLRVHWAVRRRRDLVATPKRSF
jgi:hypothetical protein